MIGCRVVTPDTRPNRNFPLTSFLDLRTVRWRLTHMCSHAAQLFSLLLEVHLRKRSHMIDSSSHSTSNLSHITPPYQWLATLIKLNTTESLLVLLAIRHYKGNFGLKLHHTFVSAIIICCWNSSYITVVLTYLVELETKCPISWSSLKIKLVTVYTAIAVESLVSRYRPTKLTVRTCLAASYKTNMKYVWYQAHTITGTPTSETLVPGTHSRSHAQ